MHKALDGLSPRLQRMKLKMMRYSYQVQYIPGKDLVIADALSRSPIEERKDEELSEEITAYIQMVIATLPATDKRLSYIWQAQQEDEVCIQLINFVLKSWPEKNALPTHLSRYWEYRHSINIQDGLLMTNARLIIPESMRSEILKAIHEGHLGITKCRARAKESIWWPGLSTQIQRMISSCDSCIKQQVYHIMIKSEFPERPWQRVGVDLLKLKGIWRHRVTDLQELEPGQVVWITDQRYYGRIEAKHAAPRSYLVETPRGIIRRNRFHLRPSCGQLEYDQDDTTRELPDFLRGSSPVSLSDDMPGTPSLYRSSPTPPSTFRAPRSPEQCYRIRSGRTVRPPDSFDL
ncbi:hypothetical protein AVEN_158360-1 [Araneus ventricosus]|uniref:RNA-directed DNA polymerase n=1 Tax=Araneus ventricosus TaxID=182803 RepID=A0A4Y2FA06_ARAVE|nr:hypothetical protein AVEN_158360-1 [Araneus ventricosus]